MKEKKGLHPLAVIFIAVLVLLTVTFVVVYAFVGFRYINDSEHELKFIGRFKDGVALSGKYYYYDGRTATLDAKSKTISFEHGEKYVGALSGNDVGKLSGYLPHGKGTLTKSDNTIFEGDFYEGYCTGNATVTYSNGDTYIGEIDHEQRNGFGTYVKADGTSYTGRFKNGNKNGFGITKFSDGSVYIGQYQNSIKEGYGAYLFDSGDIYVGKFTADVRTGNGIYIWAKSEEFSSEFDTLFNVENTNDFEASFLAYFEGDFLRYFSNGEKTEATTQNVFFQGLEAIMARNQIEYYAGSFENNELSGNGRYQWLSGRIYEGLFDKGAIVNNTTETEPAEE